MPYRQKEHRSSRVKVGKYHRTHNITRHDRVVVQSDMAAFINKKLEILGAVPTDFNTQSLESVQRKDLTF